jgi:tRNA U34 2-thiouridine synthase MnmA/TrmU
MVYMKIKAVGLLSGGLDSTLAAKIMLEQGIDVHAVNFTTPFCTCAPKKNGCSNIMTAKKQLGNIPLKRIALGDEYLNMIKSPKHGYGRGMNPCIDCRIMKIKKSLGYMIEIGASFIFTGEVLGQRPMSQHRRAIELIDKKSVDEKIIVRPLSAKKLEPTIPEIKGWLDREKLLAITGRSRKKQIALARDKNIMEYPCPAGGCLLTDRLFADRLRDYFSFTKKISTKDIPLLKLGRHFRLDNGDKIIVARDEAECNQLENLNRPDDMMFIAENFSGPTVLVQGTSREKLFPDGNTREEALNKLFEYTNAEVPEDALIRCIFHGKVEMLRPLKK